VFAANTLDGFLFFTIKGDGTDPTPDSEFRGIVQIEFERSNGKGQIHKKGQYQHVGLYFLNLFHLHRRSGTSFLVTNAQVKVHGQKARVKGRHESNLCQKAL